MVAGVISRGERWAYVAFATLVGLYLLARIVAVPVVHDEAMPFFYFVGTNDFLPFKAHNDAGNHVFTTFLGWCSWSLFGLHAWALRLPSLLAFVVFALAAFRLGAFLQDRSLRWVLWAALLLCPFLVEMFGLFRGYGWGAAGLLIAVVYMLRYIGNGRTAELLIALVGMAVATWSNLSLLVLHALLLLFLAVVLVWGRRWGQVLPLVLFGAGPWLVAVFYMLRLDASGALYTGPRSGVVEGSIASLLPFVLGVDVLWVAWCLAVLGLFLIVVALGRWWRAGLDARYLPAAAVALLLVLDVLARIGLFHLKGTLYPSERTALHWLLLFVVLLGLVADGTGWRGLRWAGMFLLLLLPLRTVVTANLTHTVLWPQQAIPASMRNMIAEQARLLGPTSSLGAYHQMPGAWAFALREKGVHAPLAQVTGHPHQATDLLLIDPLRDSAPSGYRLLHSDPGGRLDLHLRDPLPQFRAHWDTTFSGSTRDAEFVELWKPDPAAWIGQRPRFQLEAVLRSDARPLRAELVCEVQHTSGERFYDLYPLAYRHGQWQGDTLQLVIVLPPIADDVERIVVYFWNKYQQPFEHRSRLAVLGE